MIEARITPCLWFDDDLEDAVAFYTSVFPRSEVVRISRYGDAGPGDPGTAMGAEFVLDGVAFRALNGGPQFPFTEAVSFSVTCADQQEVDHYWTALSEGGEESMCGWLKDRFGLSWQIVPTGLYDLIGDQELPH